MIRGKKWVLDMPTGLQPNGVSASCTPVANATKYRWYRKTSDESPYQVLIDTTSASIPNCGLGGVGGVVSMKARAMHGAGSHPFMSPLSDEFVSVNLEGGTVPDQPTGLTVSTGGFLSWDLTPNTDRWLIERKTAAETEDDYVSPGMAMNAGDPTFQDPDIGTLADGDYDYRITAQNISGSSVPSETYRVTYSSPSLGTGTWATPFDRGYDWGQDANVTTTATSDGNWSSAGTWDNGVPTSTSTARIPVGRTVTMDASNGQVKTVSLLGNLFYATAADTKLTATQIFIYSSGYLKIGSVSSPINGANTARLMFRDSALNTTLDPRQHGNGIVNLGGKLEMCGASKTHRVRCTVNPLSGQTSITVASTPTNWASGDSVIIPETAQIMDHTSAPWQTDIRPISGSVSSTTVNLASALTYDHKGAVNAETGATDYYTWVGNMTRNVKVYSENPLGTRGHMYCTGTADVDVRRVEFTGLGRTGNHPFNNSTFSSDGLTTLSVGTNQQGRYALHFHRIYGRASVTPQAVVQDCVFAEYDRTAYPVGTIADPNVPPRWACNFHGITDAVFERNIIFNYAGSGLFNGEDGSECRNTIKDNFIIRVLGTGGRPDERGGELGYEGGHIWCRNPNNYVTGNVCCEGSVHANTRPAMGITYYARLLSSAMVPNFAGASQTNMAEMTMTDITSVPIPTGGNEDNELWGCGFYPWSVQSFGVSPHVNADWCEVNDMRILNMAGYNIYNYEVHKLRWNRLIIRADADGVRYRGERPVGYFTGDYVAGDTEIVDASITGCMMGIDFPNIGSWAKARFSVQDSHFCNYYNLMNMRIYYNAAVPNSKPLRKEVRNCTSVLMDGGVDRGVVWGPPGHINHPPPAYNKGFNHDAQIDLLYVYDWQGSVGDDFIAYFDTAERTDPIAQRQQDAGAFGAVRNSGPPESGLDNATSWQYHRACHGGRLPPASPTTRTSMNRVVLGPIATDWLPADLAGFASGIESATHRLWQYTTDPNYGPPYGGVDNDSAVGWVESPWAPFGDTTDTWRQGTAGSRPTYRKNPCRFEFDGGDYLQRITAVTLTGAFTLYVVGTYGTSALYAIFGNTTDASGIEITAANTVKFYTSGSSVTSAAITRTTGRHLWKIWRDGSNVIKFRSDESGEVTVGTLAGTLTINTLGARQFASAFVASGLTYESHILTTSTLTHGGADDLAVRAYLTATDRGLSISDFA